MSEKELEEIFALVFIEGKRLHSDVRSKTELAKKIVNDDKFKTQLSSESLLNYHRYFFGNSKKFTSPQDTTIDGLLLYINFQNLKQFRENKPTDKSYLDNVPYADYGGINDEAKFDKEKSISKESESINVVTQNTVNTSNTSNVLISNTSFKYFLFAGLCLIALVIVFSLSNKEKSNTSENSQPTVTINAENFIVSDINKIIPNQNTKFFDDNNKPQVWYASYNNEYQLYDTAGIHPITNQQLLPITNEIIKTIFVEKEIVTPDKIEVESSKAKKEISLFNTSIINTHHNKEISLFILDSINKIDNTFSNRLTQELKSKGYKITPHLIFPNKLNQEIIQHLQSGNINYFKGKIKDHTDYICIGNIIYTFSQNTIQKNKIACQMQVDYSIISSETGEIIDSYSDLTKGYGSSKISAKNNTIKKFTL